MGLDGAEYSDLSCYPVVLHLWHVRYKTCWRPVVLCQYLLCYTIIIVRISKILNLYKWQRHCYNVRVSNWKQETLQFHFIWFHECWHLGIISDIHIQICCNSICFPDDHHVVPPPQSRGSLRDRMLKESDTPPGGSNRQIFDFEESPAIRSPSLVCYSFMNVMKPECFIIYPSSFLYWNFCRSPTFLLKLNLNFFNLKDSY